MTTLDNTIDEFLRHHRIVDLFASMVKKQNSSDFPGGYKKIVVHGTNGYHQAVAKDLGNRLGDRYEVTSANEPSQESYSLDADWFFTKYPEIQENYPELKNSLGKNYIISPFGRRDFYASTSFPQ